MIEEIVYRRQTDKLEAIDPLEICDKNGCFD